MWLHSQKNEKRQKFNLYILFGIAGLLCLLSILMVACGSPSGQSQQLSANDPAPTVTFQPNKGNGTPTPGIPDYLCGAWAVDTSPNIDAGKPVDVYAKFVHTVNNNPVGVAGATGSATVTWPDGSSQVINAQTTSDGLAIFPITLQPSALNGIVLVNVSFTASGAPDCNTNNRPAFFTAVHGVPSGVTPTPSVPAGQPTLPVPPPGGATPTPTIPPIPTRPIPSPTGTAFPFPITPTP